MNYYPYIPFSANPFTNNFQSQLQLQQSNFPLSQAMLDQMQQNEEVGKPWSEWDDQRLKAAAEKYNNKGWRKICLSAFPDGSRTKEECLKRWRQLTKSVSVKGLWTAEEDAKLISLVKEMGAEKWVAIANRLETRTGKQCRERWHNHLDPRINKAPFTAEEEQLIFKLHAKIGSKWAEMSKHLPGRSDNSIKNFFNTAMQRKRKVQQANSGKIEMKRHKEAPFNWSPQDAKSFLSQYSTPNLSSDLHASFSQLNMRVMTPPDTPQPGIGLNQGFDLYNPWANFQPKSAFLAPTLHHNKLGMLNLTPITNSSPALPQGTFERAVFDQTRGIASNPVTPNNFNNGFFNPNVFHQNHHNNLHETEIKQENDKATDNLEENNNMTSAPPSGYHLGLIGVDYNGLTDNEVQDYLFMGH